MAARIARTISYSEMMDWTVCRQKWAYRYRDNLEAQQTAPRADVGSAGHYALEAHAKGHDWREALHAWRAHMVGQQPLFEEEEDPYDKVVTTLEDVIPRYLAHVENDGLMFEHVEREFEVKLPGFGVRLVGFWDAIVKDPTGARWILDYKFVQGGQFRAEEELEIDLQLGVYHWAAEQLGIHVEGTIYEQIRADAIRLPPLLASGKALSQADIVCDWPTYLGEILRRGFDPRNYDKMLVLLSGKKFFVRHYIPRNATSVENFWADTERRIHDMRRKVPAIYLSPSRANCSSCSFRELCIETMAGRDPEPIKEASFQPRTRRKDNRPPAFSEAD